MDREEFKKEFYNPSFDFLKFSDVFLEKIIDDNSLEDFKEAMLHFKELNHHYSFYESQKNVILKNIIFKDRLLMIDHLLKNYPIKFADYGQAVYLSCVFNQKRVLQYLHEESDYFLAPHIVSSKPDNDGKTTTLRVVSSTQDGNPVYKNIKFKTGLDKILKDNFSEFMDSFITRIDIIQQQADKINIETLKYLVESIRYHKKLSHKTISEFITRGDHFIDLLTKNNLMKKAEIRYGIFYQKENGGWMLNDTIQKKLIEKFYGLPTIMANTVRKEMKYALGLQKNDKNIENTLTAILNKKIIEYDNQQKNLNVAPIKNKML